MRIMKRNNVKWNLKWIFKKSYTFVGKKINWNPVLYVQWLFFSTTIINQTLLKPFYHGSWQIMWESGLWKRVSLVSLMETNTCGEHDLVNHWTRSHFTSRHVCSWETLLNLSVIERFTLIQTLASCFWPLSQCFLFERPTYTLWVIRLTAHCFNNS